MDSDPQEVINDYHISKAAELKDDFERRTGQKLDWSKFTGIRNFTFTYTDDPPAPAQPKGDEGC